MVPSSSMEQQFVKKLTDIIEANLHNEDFGVSELAEELGMSRFTLHRKVKSVVKKSVSEFIRDKRLKRAFELLQQKTGTVSEIAFSVGFGSVSYFNRCFSEHFGFPPGEVLKGLHTVPENNRNESKRTIFQKVKVSKILYIIPIIVLLAIVGYHFSQELNNKKIKKTIAVLPPKDIGPKENECVVLEGIREDLQSKLFSIAGLDVVSGTTTDTYRNSEKSLKEIAKELNVNYVVEIRGQTIAENSTIWVQLIETATDKHIWANSYEKELKDEKIQEVIRDIALVIAKELEAPITPDEKNKIEKLQTNNDAAYRYYNLGVNLLSNYIITGKSNNYIEAKKNFEKAIQLDSTFADAYCKLAEIYISYLSGYFEVRQIYNLYLDSGMVMIENAIKYGLSYQHKALELETLYYSRKGLIDKAVKSFEKIWKNKTKDYNYYYEKARLFMYTRDYYNFFENCIRYLKLKPKTVVADQTIYIFFIQYLAGLGFLDLAINYNKELYEVSNDSVQFQLTLSQIYCFNEKYDEALQILHCLHKADTTNLDYVDGIWYTSYYKRDFVESFKYAQMLEKMVKEPFENAMIGSLYLRIGRIKEAKKHIDGTYKILLEAIESNVPGTQEKGWYGYLSGVYALQGEKKKALENLRIVASSEFKEYTALVQFKTWLLWDNIREEPEFKEIVKEYEIQYPKDQKRFEELFIREGILEH